VAQECGLSSRQVAAQMAKGTTRSHTRSDEYQSR